MKKIIIASISIAAIFVSAFTIKQNNTADSYTVTTLSGSGKNNRIDGQAKKAAFSSSINHIVADASGNLYVNDGPALRKISPDGTVNTLFGQFIYDDEGNPKTIANYLYGDGYGIVLDKDNNIYTSRTTQTIVKIAGEKTATVAAGTNEQSGNADGAAASATFSEPRGMCIDKAGNIYIADSYNGRIRKISADGKTVTTLAGNNRGDYKPGTGKAAVFPKDVYGIAADSKGNIYVGINMSRGCCIAKVTPAGVVTTLAGDVDKLGPDKDGTGKAATINTITSICCDAQDNIWFTGETIVRKATPAGVVTTIAGNSTAKGRTDGPGLTARFYYLNGICADAAGNIYLTDIENLSIRKISKN